MQRSTSCLNVVFLSLFPQACEKYERAVQLNWDSPQALNNWGLALQVGPASCLLLSYYKVFLVLATLVP
jgi:hypothetical protein